MQGGGRGLVLALVVALSLLSLPEGTTAVEDPPVPANPLPLDLDPWFPGDTWIHEAHAVTRIPDGTYLDTMLTLTTRVVDVRAEVVAGRAYTVYNATVDGVVTSQGQVNVPSLGPRPFSISGSTAGWVWSDRSDLAVVRTNETRAANGTVDLSPLPDATILVSGATTITYDPAQEDIDFPLELGDAWSYNVTATTSGFAKVRIESPLGTFENTTDLTGSDATAMSLWLNATEDVSVPAGTFLGAPRIRGVAPGGTAMDRWYHGDVRNFVKMESHEVNAPDDYAHLWANLTGYTPAPTPWPGTIDLSPKRVNPGGWLTANGTANPNQDLRITIPTGGGTYTVRADGSGAWSIPIQAPVFDDFSPANTDVGSHGVLVEPAAAPSGWDVATVQLILPDLYADPAGPQLSDPSPSAGVPVLVNGTLRAGTAVSVSSPSNVSFTVDGTELQRFAVPSLTANGVLNFTSTWTPTSGWHTIAFIADPDDEVAESDEGNNTASLSVFVGGPDLVPMDIVLEGETVDAYPDPGTVGFVSTPIQGRIGGVLNVSFQVENVGTDVAGAPFAVRLVETQGLRGPPIGPPAFEATVSTDLAPAARAGPWNASWPVPNRPGVYHLNVTADADGNVTEAFEGNNTFVVIVNVSGPDYRISQVNVPAKVTAGSANSLAVFVRNDGQLLGDRTVDLGAYEGASPAPFASVSVTPLDVAEVRTVTVPWTAPGASGVVDFRFVVDDGQVMEEMDEANNEAFASVNVRDPPTTSISVDGPNVTAGARFVTDATQFSINVTDLSGEGAQAWYRVDGGAAIAFAGPFSLSGDGSHTISYWGVDGLGGTEAEHVFPVTVDATPPTTTVIVGEREGNRTLVTLSVTDAGVGVAYTEYRLDNGTWRRYVGPILVEGYGDHRITIRSVDLLGNEEPGRTVPWTILREPPPMNVKPFLAAALAAVLLLFGLWRQRGKQWTMFSPGAVALVFATAEATTGVLSLTSAELAVPPLGLALAIDVAIFAMGLYGVLQSRTLPREPALERPDGDEVPPEELTEADE